MAGIGSIAINGSVSGLLTGSKSIGPLTIFTSQSVAETRAVDLTVGNNTITCPDDATAIIIAPGSDNGDAVFHLKGITGDTGVLIHNTFPSVLALAGDTAVVINTDVEAFVEVVFI